MMRLADLPDILPVFPLPRALLLPRAHLPLHLFEPRYLAMFDDALKTEARLIGMVQPLNDGDAASGTDPELHQIGCAGRITQFSESDDGRYMITLTGVSRFTITDEVEGFTPYRRCAVDWQKFSHDRGRAETDDGFDRDTFLVLLDRFFREEGLSTDWDALREAEDEMLINALAMLCPFDAEDKQALLETPHLADRRETLVALLEYAIAASTSGSGERMQ